MIDELELTMTRPGLHRPIVVLAVAIAAGAALGIGTQVLQGWLPGAWGVVANSGVAWAVAAFGLGMLVATDRLAAPAGAVALVVAAVSYYRAVEWFEHSSSGPKGAILWSVAGVVAGPVFAVAGRWGRMVPARRAFAWALVAGTLVGEGVHLLWFVGRGGLWPAGLVELVLGGVLVVRSMRGSPPPSMDRGRAAAYVIAIAGGAVLATLLAGRLIDHGFAML